MQSDSFQVQFERLAVHVKCVDAIAVRRKVIRYVAFRIAAEIADIELGVAIQDGFELTSQFGAVCEPLVLRHLAKVQVSPCPAVVFGVRGFEKCHDGALRGIAIQRIFVRRRSGWFGGGWVGFARRRRSSESRKQKTILAFFIVSRYQLHVDCQGGL